MKLFPFLFLLIFTSFSAQQKVAIDSLKVRGANEIYADDYGNFYIYENRDFSLTKYSANGFQLAKLMLTLPFKVQSVQNPLYILAFSENAQEMRFFDQNLNEIEKVDFRQKFGYIKVVYAEDQRQIWLLDESTKRLILYDFRDDRVRSSIPVSFNLDEVKDLLIYRDSAYVLYPNKFLIYNFRTEKFAEINVENAGKLRRENADVLVTARNTIFEVENDSLKTIFHSDKAQIVDKNSASYFEVRDGKLYLYPLIQ
jgi:hypothetical protein